MPANPSSAGTPASTQTLYVAPDGKDAWSGTLPDPNAAGTDGPFATVDRARTAACTLKRQGRLTGQLTVQLRGGTYPLTGPLRFDPDDSGPITYAAYPGEQPVLDGGRRITGWRADTINGTSCWVADLPDVAAGKWAFRQLFVNGERRERARLPKRRDGETRTFWMADVPGTPFTAGLFDGTDSFVCGPGDVQPWPSLATGEAEAVVLHYWSEERLPIAGFDPGTNTVRLGRRSVFSLKDDFVHRYARYYVENVLEALTDPGEWYLDRAAGRLYYVPLPGETPETAEVVAPAAERLLVLEGDPDAGRFVEFLRFQGLTFRHTDWQPPLDSDHRTGVRGEPVPWAVGPQAARTVPGALSLLGARYCAIEDCTVERIGGYAIYVGAGCRGVRVVGNTLRDLGAGGVKLWGTDAEGPRARRTGDSRVTDNHIHGGGRVFPSACGVLAMHAFGNTISHNHIHDLYYTGISCGWVWGYRENVSRDNRIERNHIHHLGHRLLSDMGGIYTLGVQPGTVLRGNVIHHVEKHTYGGWGVYLDEGSSHILVEGNLVHSVSSNAFNQHYGRENVVRHNVFAFGREGQVSLTRREDHLSFTLLRNVLLGEGAPAYANRGRAHFTPGLTGNPPGFIAEANFIWDTTWPTGGPSPDVPIAANGRNAAEDGHWFLESTCALDEWRSLGQDLHSVLAAPGFRDPLSFPLEPESAAGAAAPGSPAETLAVVRATIAGAGVRPPNQRD